MDSDDPHQYEWFYGRISSNQADQLLKRSRHSAGENGTFLVREQLYRAGYFVISILYDDSVFHYTIQPDVNTGKFYIHEDLQFSNLDELIQYYKRHISTLKCKLKTPLKRPEGARPISYLGSNLTKSQITAEVKKELSKLSGSAYSYSKTTAPVKFQIEQAVLKRMHRNQSWYFPNITREEAENILRPYIKQKGFFLVRKYKGTNSTYLSRFAKTGTNKIHYNEQNTFVKYILSVCEQMSISHYQITQLNDMLTLYSTTMHPMKQFGSLVQLIDYYFREFDILSVKLIVKEDVLARIKTQLLSYPSLHSKLQIQCTVDKAQQSWIDTLGLTIGQVIGTGYYGVVCKGLLVRNGDFVKVAIKHQKCNDNQFHGQESFIEEGKIMKKLRNPNVVFFYGFKYINNKLLMILEYTDCGSLINWLHKNPIYIKTIVAYMYQICSGMAYITSLNIVHRDLAARNVLLFDNYKTAKITDFGLARDLSKYSVYEASTKTSWPTRWYPPESINKGIFSEKSDVWSFGVTCWEMWTRGSIPYSNVDESYLYSYIINGKRLPLHNVQRYFSNLLKNCWKRSPDKRPSFKDIKIVINTYQIKNGKV
ncbi:hypothetical protein GJ496_003382 [Pomphorhynchus laevis]|nr:hypothetical protein GJ496_003382 [Pomphorhynchus laevis]